MGMLVDISHVSHKTMLDVAEITTAPLFFSHSSAYGICPTPRNVPDQVLLKMKSLDGIIMINFWPDLISCQETATLEQVADHIEYISKLIGPEYVGFGSDFDGASTSKGLEDVSKYPNLLAELVRLVVIRLTKSFFLRVLQKTEEAARRKVELDESRLPILNPSC